LWSSAMMHCNPYSADKPKCVEAWNMTVS
jgi:hypothetical protein